MKRNLIFITLLTVLFSLLMTASALAGHVLNLPAGTKVIEEEAFYGDESLEEVVLPEGVVEIGPRAFANSGLRKITLPTTLTLERIADDAIDKNKDVVVKAIEGTDAYRWATSQGFTVNFEPTPGILYETRTEYVLNPEGTGWITVVTATVSGYEGDSKEVYIPSVNGDGYKVTGINYCAFQSSDITKVVIPEGVRKIGSEAFYNCKSLTAVYLPESLKEINVQAFAGCISLEEAALPSALESLGEYAFYDCSSLTAVTIPSGITEIGKATFYGCSSLSNLTLPDSITEIADYAFAHCNLTDIGLPAGLKKLGFWAFGGNGFVRVTIPDGLEEAGNRIFDYTVDQEITAHVNSTGAKAIGKVDYKFMDPDYYPFLKFQYKYENNELEGLYIMDCLDKDITSVDVPSGVVGIDFSAFNNCGKLSVINVPDTVIKAKFGCYPVSKDLKVYLPDYITSPITDYNFYNNFSWRTEAEGIWYADSGSVTAESLSRVKLGFCDPDISESVVLGYEYDDNGTEIVDTVAVKVAKDERRVVLPGIVTKIARNFAGQASVEEIVLPEGIQEIGKSAFSASSDWPNLKRVNIPNSVTVLGDSLIYHCTAPMSITLGENVTCFTDETFQTSNSANKPLFITKYDSEAARKVGSLGFLFSDPAYPGIALKLDSNNEWMACAGATEAEYAVIPNGVTSIRSGAFSGCTKLKTCVIPTTIKSIGDAFGGCKSLESLVIPESISNIPQNAFSRCSNLREVYLPGTITSIEQSAFSDCSMLQTIHIPDSVQSIGDWVFSGCSSLKRVKLPEGLSNIPYMCFNGCSSLSEIYIPFSTSMYVDNSTNFSVSIPILPSGQAITVYGQAGSSAERYCEHYDNLTFTTDPWPYGPGILPGLAGSFTEEEITVVMGDQIIPDATVISTGAPIHRITLTINNWNQDGTNANRYRTHVFEGQNLYSVSLTDPDLGNTFALDTAQRPLNIPGEYVINLWADLEEHGGKKLDSMKVKVISTDNTISGIITLESGEPLSNVGIYLYNSSDRLVGYTCTDITGRWKIEGLTEGESYTVYYRHDLYVISGSAHNVSGGSSLTATASLRGTQNSEFSFIMKQGDRELHNGDSVSVGKPIHFTVTAPGAEAVRLIVDGKEYEEYSVIDDEASFTRAFSQAKETARSIRFHIRKAGDLDYSDLTPMQELYVTSNGSLNPVKNIVISEYALTDPDPLTISWEAEEHASGYKVYFYYDGIGRFFPDDENSSMTYTTTNSLTYKPAPEYPKLFAGNQWYVEIVAIGEEGWGSSTSTSNTFEITETASVVEILSPAEGYQAEIEENLFIEIGKASKNTEVALEITKEGFPVSASDIVEVSNGYYFHIKSSGQYVVNALVNGVLCDTRCFSVKKPEVISFYEHEGKPYYTYADELPGTVLDFHVVYNFIPTRVVLYKDDNPIEGSTIVNSTRNWQFTINDTLSLSEQDLDAGYGTYHYSVFAYYGDNSEEEKVSTTTFTVYCVKTTNTSNELWYTNRTTEVYSRPDGSISADTLPPQTYLTLGARSYGKIYEAFLYGKKIYVNIDHLTKESNGSGGITLSIQSSMDISDDILMLDTENGYSGFFDIQSAANIDSVNLKIMRISDTDYDMANMERYEEVYSDLTATYTDELPYYYNIPFDVLEKGMYRFVFLAHDKERNIWLPYQEERFDKYFYGVTKADPSMNTKVYLLKDETLPLYDNPAYIKNAVTEYNVSWDQEMTILGYAGNGAIYVTVGAGNDSYYGFIQYDALSEYMNQPVVRGCLILSHDIFTEDRYNGTVKTPSINAMATIHNLYSKMNANIVIEDYNTNNAELNQHLSRIANINDFNDTVYIYILAHGADGIMVMENQLDIKDKKADYYYYTDLANKLKEIDGNIILFLNPCESGSFIRTIEQDTFFIQKNKRYSIITGAYENENASVISSELTENGVWNARFAYVLDQIYTNYDGGDMKLSRLYQHLIDHYYYSHIVDPTVYTQTGLDKFGDLDNIVFTK